MNTQKNVDQVLVYVSKTQNETLKAFGPLTKKDLSWLGELLADNCDYGKEDPFTESYKNIGDFLKDHFLLRVRAQKIPRAQWGEATVSWTAQKTKHGCSVTVYCPKGNEFQYVLDEITFILEQWHGRVDAELDDMQSLLEQCESQVDA